MQWIIFRDVGQVPVFAFGSGGPDLIVTSSNSGLPGQEGLDRTAMDIQQFARGGDAAQAQEVVEEEEIEVDESEEGGVSSIVSSSEQQGGSRPSRARQVITWDQESSSGTSSSSPQRQHPARAARGAVRGTTRPARRGLARRGQ